MSYLYGLGYIGFGSSDLSGWEKFGTAVLGGEVRRVGAEVQVRLDDRAYRLLIEEGEDALAFVGWEVAGHAELDAVIDLLTANGIEVTEDPELATRREVARLARATDPAGNALEFFCGARQPKRVIEPARGDVKYVTGALGLGHVVVTVPDLAAAKHFYLDLLGFKISDIIGVSHFTRTNRRHHSLAFREHPGPSLFRHFSLELEDLDMVGRAMDAAAAAGFPVSCELGRHVNDRMISFYVRTPSGFEVEIGTGGRTVDDATWTTGSYDSTSFWGHRRLIPIG